MAGFFDWLFGNNDEPEPLVIAYRPPGYVPGQAEAQKQAELEAQGWTSEKELRLRDYCDVFEIPFENAKDDPIASLNFLLAAYALPLCETSREINEEGNKIRREMSQHWGVGTNFGAGSERYRPEYQFFSKLSATMAQMQVFPSWFSDFTASAEKLVEIWESLNATRDALEKAGLASGTALGLASTTDAVKGLADPETGRPNPGPERPGDRRIREGGNRLRNAGRGLASPAKRIAQMPGNATDVLNKNLPANKQVPRAAGNIFAIIGIGIGITAHHNIVIRMETIEDLVRIKYREGDATAEQWDRVNGDINLTDVNLEKYWE